MRSRPPGRFNTRWSSKPEGEQVFGRVCVDESLLLHDGKVELTRGIYHDTYQVEDGQWVFGRRHFDLIYAGPPDMSGRFFPTAGYGPPPPDPDPTRAATPSYAAAYG